MTDDTINNGMTMGGAGAMLLANRYRVVRQLGQGGMGSVWLAEDTELDNRQVAVKMLPSILLANKRAYKQIKAEALVSLKLTHPNIATFRSFEENEGNPFLVIDYINGQTLDDYLADKGTLTEQEVMALLSPIASALDYAHSKNVIHRDIKPGNVMVANDGTPYILDFGIAREVQETMTRVTGKLSSGTLMYMSPEQLHGAAPSAAQDVYSFTAMVYECLTGAPPFSRGQIEYQIEHDAPAPLPDDIAIANLIMAGLSKDPAKRPITCALILGGSSSIPAGCDMSSTPISSASVADSEYDRTQAEIRKYEAILAQREADKRAALEAQKKAKELREAKKRLQQLRRQVGEPDIKDAEAGLTRMIKLTDTVKLEMVYCPPGSFNMGSAKEENQCDRDEPTHTVNLTKGFWIGKYPITQEQWRAIMGDGGGFLGFGRKAQFSGDDHPMENISWEESVDFAVRISSATGIEFRLPTEAEWEYACRAGSDEAVSGTGQVDSMAWYAENSGRETHSVGKRSPNDWGLHDMHGNVWEWCADWFGAYSSNEEDDPIGPKTGSSKVLRGGGWGSGASFCHCASRLSNQIGSKGGDIGFRICADKI